MSLFASSFTPATTPVVDSNASSARHNKRKRTSEASAQAQNRTAAYGERNTVKSAQQNIEKLMKVLDKGSVVGKKTKASSSSSARRKSTGKLDDDAPLTMDELRRRLAEEDQKPSKGGDADGSHEEPKKKKIKYGLDGRPILPPGVASIAELEGKTKSKPKGRQSLPAKQEEKKPDAPAPTEEASSDEEDVVPAVPAPMTPLQSSLANKLSSAKFRWLNEQLYTLPSTEAWDLMRKEGGSAFADYHDSHRQQTAAWPSPPLPYIISAIRARSQPTNLIVDLGCGDASLAKELNGINGYTVLSYDLVGDVQPLPLTTVSAERTSARGWVVPGDFLDSVPLPGEPGGDEHAQEGFKAVPVAEGKKKGKKQAKAVARVVVPQVVDTVVCCLSLMGVNWVGGIYEAARILKTGGVFHVAEVTSRLISNPEFIKLVESFGFHLDEHTAPTTHFDLFRFTKTSFAPLGVVKGQQGWEARLAQGTKIMKGCVYKKR